MIEKAVYMEEDFILKYDNENIWTLLGTLPKEKFEKIKKIFGENISETGKHRKILNEVLEKAKGGEYEL
jgi:hypothetical protein